MSKREAFWLILVFIVSFLVATAMMSPAQTLQHHAEPPVKTLSCSAELDQIRFRLWTVSGLEAKLAVRTHRHADAVFYFQQAQSILDTPTLKPSPETCLNVNLKRLEIDVAFAELTYTQEIDALKKTVSYQVPRQVNPPSCQVSLDEIKGEMLTASIPSGLGSRN